MINVFKIFLFCEKYFKMDCLIGLMYCSKYAILMPLSIDN